MTEEAGSTHQVALLMALNSCFDLVPHALTLYYARDQREKSVFREWCAIVKDLPAPDQLFPKLSRTVVSLSLIDEATTISETVSIVSDLLGSLFHTPSLAIGLRCDEAGTYLIAGEHGFAKKPEAVPEAAISLIIDPQKVKRAVRLDKQTRGVFGAIKADTIATFPITSAGVLLGFVSFFDCQLQLCDLQLVGLITIRLAAKLRLLKKAQEQEKLSELSKRLMSHANTLLSSQSKEDLYGIVLEIAADLLSACQGSIMLIDKNGEDMHVVQTKGMSKEIARYLRMQVGRGIAGKVAKSGAPLLVDDVEKDPDLAMRNRPRFKSKSLISIPLKLNEKVLGVLNLSDKANLTRFDQADLKLLTSFSTLASLVIERWLITEETFRFEQLSLIDPLTGIYNRRFLDARLEEELNRSLRQGLEFTVLFIDLDHFKKFNDRFGHLAGDAALRKTADIIKASLRDMDMVARYGGEEFCVLLPGTSKRLSLQVAERILAGIAQERFPCGARLTASLGIASFPEDAGTLASLLHASDKALYQAKAGGRNRLVAAQPAPAGNLSPSFPGSGNYPAPPAPPAVSTLYT